MLQCKTCSALYPKSFQAFKELVPGNNMSNLVHLHRIRGQAIKEVLCLVQDLRNSHLKQINIR